MTKPKRVFTEQQGAVYSITGTNARTAPIR
jgi:hypothetical protein